MKKILVVAHPDDEVLWFNPDEFDRIIVVFLEREDSKEITAGRIKTMSVHPLKDKMTWFNLKESNYWRDKTKEREYKDGYDTLNRLLQDFVEKDIEFWTHNTWGEYGHSDHILVNQAVTETAERYKIPVYCYNGIEKIGVKNPISIQRNMVRYNELKQMYIKNCAWTYKQHIPEYALEYFKA